MKKSMYPEGSAQEEMAESPAEEAKEPPSEHELDMHHDTLMKAESIRSDKHLMKHLQPHMQKKMQHLKMAVNKNPAGNVGMPEHEAPDGKITSIEGLKKKEKSMKY